MFVFIFQGLRENLGISISGGRGQRGDVPIFVASIQQDGCVGRDGQLHVSVTDSSLDSMINEGQNS